MRQKLLLVAAVFFGILAFVLTYQLIESEREKATRGISEEILIFAKENLSAGDVITEKNTVRKKERVSRAGVTVNKLILNKDSARIMGSKLQYPIKKNTPITWNDIESLVTDKNTLAPRVPVGQRAISISVDATSSVTGLIRPGNYVDVIGTFRFPELKGDKAFDTLTLTILQSVKIIATGTELEKARYLSGNKRRSRGYSTVTIALHPKEVEMIIFATQKGRLSLSLRNPDDVMFEHNLQSINFKFLEKNIKKYNEEREKRIRTNIR